MSYRLSPWQPPPPDWEAERLEALARERAQQEQARARFLEQELARIAAEDEHTYPKPPAKKRKWRT